MIERYLIVLPLAAACIAAGMAGCGNSHATTPGGGAAAAAPPPMVAVTLPVQSLYQPSLEYTGRIEASQRVEVRSRVAGYLQRIAFRDGQQVKAGDPLFVIDPRPFEAARDRAQAGLAQAEARASLARAQSGRSERLMRTGATSAEELERTRAEAESAEAAVLLARAELRSAALELSFTTVRAPIAGVVSDRRVDVGNYVAGGGVQGAALTTIVATSPARAVVDLSEADYQRLRARGSLPREVQLTLDGRRRRQAARVDFVDNEIGARSGTVRLRASLADADPALLPGSFVRVSIPVGPAAEHLLVPDSAIVTDQDKRMLFVVDAGNVVAPRKIELGGLVGNSQVVLSGLAPGEQVIVSGAARVRPGDRVRVAPARAGGA